MSISRFLLLGLGNPGHEYTLTRHNTGFRVVEAVASTLNTRFKRAWFSKYKIANPVYKGVEFYLVKPLTFMNRSGDILPKVLRRTGCTVSDLVVICDNMDLPPGASRIKEKGSDAGQRGLASVINLMGTKDFLRVFTGIGRPLPGTSVIDHVLGIPGRDQAGMISLAEDRIASALLCLGSESKEKVFARINKRSPD